MGEMKTGYRPEPHGAARSRSTSRISRTAETCRGACPEALARHEPDIGQLVDARESSRSTERDDVLVTRGIAGGSRRMWRRPRSTPEQCAIRHRDPIRYLRNLLSLRQAARNRCAADGERIDPAESGRISTRFMTSCRRLRTSRRRFRDRLPLEPGFPEGFRWTSSSSSTPRSSRTIPATLRAPHRGR